jgi:hypothetical protein
MSASVLGMTSASISSRPRYTIAAMRWTRPATNKIRRRSVQRPGERRLRGARLRPTLRLSRESCTLRAGSLGE